MKKLIALLVALCLLPSLAAAETIVTSFYPIYLFTLNLTDGLDGVTVRNLAAPDTGCLHDYQLQTGDMKSLSEADAFLINGAGMESYLDHVFEAFPDLPVTDASVGIDLLQADPEELAVGIAEGPSNAHVWLDPTNAATMVANLADGLMAACPDGADAIAANRDVYLRRLEALDAALSDGLADLPHRDIVTFHEAFPYFANAYGLNVAAVVNREPGDALSPAALGQLVLLMRELGAPPLFVEPQYDDLAAQTLARETGAVVYTLDPVVTGPEDAPLTYYEDTMLENMRVLQAALAQP